MNTPNLTLPPPPLPRWERLAAASARLGIPARAIRQAQYVRVAKFGPRGLLHVAVDDVEEFARVVALRDAPWASIR